MNVCSEINNGDGTSDETTPEEASSLYASVHTIDSDATEDDAPTYINNLNTTNCLIYSRRRLSTDIRNQRSPKLSITKTG